MATGSKVHAFPRILLLIHRIIVTLLLDSVKLVLSALVLLHSTRVCCLGAVVPLGHLVHVACCWSLIGAGEAAAKVEV